MGSLFKRTWIDKDGNKKESQYWSYKTYLGKKQLYYTTKLTNKRKAREKALQWEAEIKKSGVPHDFGKTKYADLKTGIIASYKKKKRRSMPRLNQALTHLDSFFKHYKAIEISTDLIDKYILDRQAAGAADATINRELSALKHMFKIASKSTPPKVGFIPQFDMLKEDNVRTGFFEYPQFNSLKNFLPSYLRGFVTFAYKTGVRDRELKSITWDQVDFDNGVVILEKGSVKTGEGRYIPLDPELIDIIDAQKKKRRKRGRLISYVFTNASGTDKIGDIRSAWNTACRKAKLGYGYRLNKRYVEKWSQKLPSGPIMHDFRRTAVRNMIRAGIPQTVAMKITGHKTDSVFRRYDIVDTRDIKEAMVRLNGYLKDQKGEVKGTVTELSRTDSN